MGKKSYSSMKSIENNFFLLKKEMSKMDKFFEGLFDIIDLVVIREGGYNKGWKGRLDIFLIEVSKKYNVDYPKAIRDEITDPLFAKARMEGYIDKQNKYRDDNLMKIKGKLEKREEISKQETEFLDSLRSMRRLTEEQKINFGKIQQLIEEIRIENTMKKEEEEEEEEDIMEELERLEQEGEQIPMEELERLERKRQEEEVGKLKSDLNEALKVIDSFEDEKKRLNDDLKVVENQKIEVEKQLKDAQTELVITRDKVNELSSLKTKNIFTLKSNQTLIAELERSEKNLQDMVTSLNKKLAEVNSDLKVKENKISEYENQISKSIEYFEELQEQRKRDIQKNQEEKDRLNEKLKLKEKTEIDLKQEISNLRDEIGKKQGDVSKLETKVISKQKEFEKIEKDIFQLKKDITEKETTIKNLETLIQFKETKITQISGVVEKQKLEIEKIKNDLENVKSQLKKSNQENIQIVNDNQNKLKVIEDNLKQKDIDIENLKKSSSIDVKQREKKIKAVEFEKNMLIRQLEELKNDMENQKIVSNEKIDSLKIEVENYKNQVKLKQDEMVTLMDEQERKIVDLKKEQERKIDDLKKEQEGGLTPEQTKNVESEMIQMSQRLETTLKQNEMFRKNFARYDRELSDLTKKHQEALDELEDLKRKNIVDADDFVDAVEFVITRQETGIQTEPEIEVEVGKKMEEIIKAIELGEKMEKIVKLEEELKTLKSISSVESSLYEKQIKELESIIDDYRKSLNVSEQRRKQERLLSAEETQKYQRKLGAERRNVQELGKQLREELRQKEEMFERERMRDVSLESERLVTQRLESELQLKQSQLPIIGGAGALIGSLVGAGIAVPLTYLIGSKIHNYFAQEAKEEKK